eukprot:6931434-Heterocapsa_arctica.AAC.1
MATASGVSSAVYGNAAAPASIKEIDRLRTAVKGCCLKGIMYANNNAFFFWLGLHWRAAPGGPRDPGPVASYASGAQERGFQRSRAGLALGCVHQVQNRSSGMRGSRPRQGGHERQLAVLDWGSRLPQ